MQEISAGGVVIQNNAILTLRKYRGDWVLPKGRVEEGETLEQTALREVKEETGADAEIVRYIGYVKYLYRHINGEKVHKTVHYFYMKTKTKNLIPQKEEGFAEAVFLNKEKAMHMIKHDAEKRMVRKAIEFNRR